MSRSSPSQRRASRSYRRRAAARGLARVELRVSREDGALLRAVADRLKQGDPERAAALRSTLREALAREEPVRTVLDIFGSDLPDEVFEGVFDAPRTEAEWRSVEL